MGFIALTQVSARWRAALWRWCYDRLAAGDAVGEYLFMNYGYAEPYRKLVLRAEDEAFRYPIQLYAHVVDGVELRGKDVVEVGSGRGGGASFLVRYREPRSYTGVDLSAAAIARCRERFGFANADWRQGGADALPLADASADVVANVESSHCYPSMVAFVAEVTRVLRPGGYFAFCDLRLSARLAELDRCLEQSGLAPRERRVITPQVVRALDYLSPSRERMLTRVPRLLRGAFRDFIGVKDTIAYNMLADGRMVYVSYLLQKPA